MSLWSWRWCWWAPWCCAPAQLPRAFSPWRLRSWRCCRWRRSRHGPTRGWPSSLRGSLCVARHRRIITGSGNASAWWWFLGSCSAAWMTSSFCWGLTRHYVFFFTGRLCVQKQCCWILGSAVSLVSLSWVYSKHTFGPLWPLGASRLLVVLRVSPVPDLCGPGHREGRGVGPAQVGGDPELRTDLDRLQQGWRRRRSCWGGSKTRRPLYHSPHQIRSC